MTSNKREVTNINAPIDDQLGAHKTVDSTYFTRGYATSVNLHCRSLSVDSGIEETYETKWINSPFLKVRQRTHISQYENFAYVDKLNAKTFLSLTHIIIF